MFRRPLVRCAIPSLALGLAVGACSHFQVDTRPIPKVVATTPKNETVRVKTRDARTVEVSEPRLERDTLFGYSRGSAVAQDRPVVLPLREVESLSTRQFKTLESVGLVVGILTVIFFGAVLWH